MKYSYSRGSHFHITKYDFLYLVKLFCCKLLFLILSVFFFGSCNRNEIISPRQMSMVDAVFASGSLAPDNEYQLTAQAEGIVQQIQVDEGDLIQKGQLLMTISSPAEEAQLLAAQTALRQAKTNTDTSSPYLQSLLAELVASRERVIKDSLQAQRYEQLSFTNAISKSQYEDAYLNYVNARSDYLKKVNSYENVREDLQVQLENTKASFVQANELVGMFVLRSEIDGKVYRVDKKTGELARKGEPLASLGSAEKLIVELKVAEDDIAKIEIGQEVLVNLNNEPNNTYPAKITKIYPAFDASDQSFRIDAEFDKQPSVLYSGVQLEANIIISKHENVLAIPPSYLTENREVKLTDGNLIPVSVGIITPEWVEITGEITTETKLKKP